jgi:hypothetical protein
LNMDGQDGQDFFFILCILAIDVKSKTRHENP